jgi:tetratricopeptide (TPR) repeat protein
MNSGSAEEFRGTDRFEIHRRLGAGGMGVVYEAYDRQRRMAVALKTLRHVDATAIYRFKQEFRALSDLSHPNLVRLHELLTDEDRWFFTMELIEGHDFLSHIRSDANLSYAETVTYDAVTHPLTNSPHSDSGNGLVGSPLSAPQISRLRSVLAQLAAGLHALHEARKLHRDIKPSNVLVTRQGRVVLLDFGLVAELDRESRQHHTDEHPVGTIDYMSPEQAAGQPLSEASDWYSVGVILYAALTGRCLFSGTALQIVTAKQKYKPAAPASLVPDVPEDLNLLCMSLLRIQPDQRPSGIEILQQIGVKRADGGSPETASLSASGDAPFVGRDRHIAALSAAFTATQQGRTTVIRVHGRSGVGKTALLSRFIESLTEQQHAVVLTGRCYERESVPYKALDSLVDSLSRYLMKLPQQQAETLMPRDVLVLARLFPVLRRVDAVALAPRRIVDIPDQQEMRRRAFAALRELLMRLGDRKPLVLYIDDLQWGDVDSANLLADLLRPPDPPVLLLLACHRSEDETTSPFLRTFLETQQSKDKSVEQRELLVDALTVDEARELALALLGDDSPQVAALADAAAQESGGNPYFVSELLHFVRTGGGLSAGSTSDRAITLDEVLGQRVARLSKDARRLLEVVSVAGQPLPQHVAQRAAALGQDDRGATDVLRAGHLVRTTGPSEHDDIETYHDRIRETVVRSLAADVLQQRHRALALALEASGEADPETLGAHFFGAGEPDRAGEYYAQAAQQAVDALAFDRAAALYRRELELHPPDDAALRALRTSLGDALANAGRGAEAAREYQLAAGGASAAQRLELQRRAAMQSLISGHVDEGLTALRSVLTAVGMKLAPTPLRALLSLLLRRAQLRLRGLNFRERDNSQISAEDLTRIDICWSAAMGLSIVDTVRGADFQTRNLLLSLRAGEPYRVARALAWEAAHVATSGEPAKHHTAKLLGEARRIAQRIDHPHALGLCTLTGGIEAYMTGRWKQARAFSDQALETFRSRCTGVAWEIDTAQSFFLWSLFFLGEVAELGRCLPVVLKEAQERGDLYAATNSGTFVGYLTWLADDDPDGARRSLSDVMQQWSHQGFHVQHLTGLMAQTQIDLYTGDGQAAWDRLQQRWPEMKASYFLRVQTVRIFMHHLRARSALAAAEASSAARHKLLRAAERDAHRIRRERNTWSQPMADILEAGIAVLRGQTPRAQSLLAAATAGFDATHMSLFAAAARRRQGELLGGDAGSKLIQESDRWMAQQHIRNPLAMTRQHAPGFPVA